MGIKLGSVILSILFLFIAKISFEASIDTNANAPQSAAYTGYSGRSPASMNSIDEGYAAHMSGPEKTEKH